MILLSSLESKEVRALAELFGLPSIAALRLKQDVAQQLEEHINSSSITRTLYEELKAAAPVPLPPTESPAEGTPTLTPSKAAAPTEPSSEFTAMIARIKAHAEELALMPPKEATGNGIDPLPLVPVISAELQAQFATRLALERTQARERQEEEEDRKYEHYKRTHPPSPRQESIPPRHGQRQTGTQPSIHPPVPSFGPDPSTAQLAASVASLTTLITQQQQLLQQQRQLPLPLPLVTDPPPPSHGASLPVCLDDPDVLVGVIRAPFEATVLAAIREGTQPDQNKLLQPPASARLSDQPESHLTLDPDNVIRAHTRTVRSAVSTLLDLVDASLCEIRHLSHPELIPDRLSFLRRLLCFARARGPAAAIKYADLVRTARLQRPEAATSVVARTLDGHHSDAYAHMCTTYPLTAASGSLFAPSTGTSPIARPHAPRTPADRTTQTCYNWNAGMPCKHTPCSWAHQCSHCSDASHPRSLCPSAPPARPARARPLNVVHKPPRHTGTPAPPGGTHQ